MLRNDGLHGNDNNMGWTITLNRPWLIVLAATMITWSLVALLGGCSGEVDTPVADIADGSWMGEGGPEQFYFDISRDENGELTGTIHIMTEGRKRSEMPISRVTWDPPELELCMDATGVTYRGEVDLGRGLVKGALYYAESPGNELNLKWADPDEVPGLRCRMATAEGAQVYTSTCPPDRGDGWETAEPEAVGIDHQIVERLVLDIIQGEAGLLHSILIAKNGKLVVDNTSTGIAGKTFTVSPRSPRASLQCLWDWPSIRT